MLHLLDDPRPVPDQAAVDAAAAVGDRRERAAHVQRVDGERAEADREVGVERAGDAEVAGRFDDPLRSDELRQLRVDGVVGMHHRLRQVDPAQVGALVVAHGPDPVAGIDLHRLRLELGQRRDPLAEGRRQHDRLEGGARLSLRLRGQVELAAAEARAAEHRLDGAVARVDRDEGGGGAVRVRQHLLDRATRRLLQGEVDRRTDAQTPAEHAPGAVALDELVRDVIDEVPSGSPGAGQADVRGIGQRLGVRAGNVDRIDAALFCQRLEHVKAALTCRPRVPYRVEPVGVGREAGEQRCLVQRQHARSLVEVRPGRLLDPVGAVPEVDRVEVRDQDAVLAPALLELPRQRRLSHLAPERPLVAHIGVLDELLRDRRPPLDDLLLADVLPERATDTAQVDAAVLVEPLVLDRDDRLPHQRRDIVDRLDQHAALVATEHRQHARRRGVRVVDDAVKLVRALLAPGVERRDLARDRANQTEAERRARHDEQH